MAPPLRYRRVEKMTQNGRHATAPRLRLVTAPWASLYDLPVDAVVEEQDRYRVLGLDEKMPLPVTESYPRLITAADQETPVPLGSLLRGGGRPLRLKAVILDIERGERVEVAHLREVADRLCRLVDDMPIRRLGMPLLGAVHGDASPALFASVFGPRLRVTGLETLYLLTGSNPEAAILRQLREAFGPAAT